MVAAPAARSSSPPAAVSWQQSCQPDCGQSSGPVPLSIRFMQLARMGHYAGALLSAAQSLLTGWDDSNGDRYSENTHL